MSLPDELTRAQPYSMGPLLHWAPLHKVPQVPSTASVRIDRWQADIAQCLVAPRAVQKLARAAGVNQVIMIYPQGIEKVNPALARRQEAAADNLVDALARELETIKAQLSPEVRGEVGA